MVARRSVISIIPIGSKTFNKLCGTDYTITMAEQNLRFACLLDERFCVIEHGKIVGHFEAAQLDN